MLDRLGVHTTVVYGTSMGGRVAQMVAIHHPERVTALVLADTSAGGASAFGPSGGIRQALDRATPTERLDILRDVVHTPAGRTHRSREPRSVIAPRACRKRQLTGEPAIATTLATP